VSLRCPACSSAVSDDSRFCPGCGAALAERASEPTSPYLAAAPSVVDAKAPPISTKSADETRFAPGQVLAGRYRIVAALGKGGMGVVYRADDLALGQPVALKFLPSVFADAPDRLARFRKEVATARRVSHPNACRVYDLVEVDGQPALTMEYVDGEDLAVTLRRFGRLPEEKAVQIARELCGALAAVHDEGLLHRDLKPANVMLDGRGRVRLTDFGLAAAAAELTEVDVYCGTPAYMAPEQLASREVTVRSDIFALGMVLYEVFTGKTPFVGADRDTPPSKPSSHITGLDPAVERVILRCLEHEPNDRPSSARVVAAALPGGDLLAAALAAGETPSPQLVADAGGEGTIRPAVGLALLATVLAGIVGTALLADHVMLFRKVPLPEPPQVLIHQARQILEQCGYDESPADWTGHFRSNAEVLLHILKEDPSPDRWENLATLRPTPLYFFYRQSPGPLAPTSIYTAEFENLLVTDENPPPVVPGMAGVHLSPTGQLLRFYAIPPRQSDAAPTHAEPEWGRWFDSTSIGFDITKELRPVSPEWSPPCACDRQAAWAGALPDRPDVSVRVEAAAYRGRPVYFEILPGWRQSAPVERRPGFLLPLGFVLAAGLLLLAIRNLRRGRGDLCGARRLALAILGVQAFAWLIGGHHTLSQEASQLAAVLGVGGWFALEYGLGYLALEPSVRRRWPRLITSWNRLLGGRLRDPMVGRDLLIGFAFGTGLMLVLRLAWLALGWFGAPLPPFTGTGPFALQVPGPPAPLYMLLSLLTVPIVVPVLYLMLSYVFGLILRRELLAWAGLWLFLLVLFMIPILGGPAHSTITFAFFHALHVTMWVFVTARFGLLATAAALFATEMLMLAPLTTDFSAWYAQQGALIAVVIFGLAVCAFLTATRGQRLLAEGFFGDG
jgi:serine/threonine-protein kinase